MTINVYNAGAYLLSVGLGAVFVTYCLRAIRALTKQPQDRGNLLAILLGCVERAVATTLILYASGHYLPQFIGAWVTLKFAASWSRYKGIKYAEGHIIGLIGSVLSFGFAIWATLQMRPDLFEKLAAGP
jgi:hypothetical protein